MHGTYINNMHEVDTLLYSGVLGHHQFLVYRRTLQATCHNECDLLINQTVRVIPSDWLFMKLKGIHIRLPPDARRRYSPETVNWWQELTGIFSNQWIIHSPLWRMNASFTAAVTNNYSPFGMPTLLVFLLLCCFCIQHSQINHICCYENEL